MSYYITMEETTCKPILDELAKDNMVQLERPMISEMQKGGNYFGGGFVLYPTDASPVCMYFNMAVNTIEAPIYVLTVEPAKDAYTLLDNKMGKGLLCTDKILVTNAECLNTDFVFDRFVDEVGYEEACKKVALPGSSEHQTGLAFDIAYMKNGEYQEKTSDEDPEIIWLKENSYKYGFILRYPLGKEKITGYSYERWHYRFVGIELATTLYEEGLTLEEYYERLKGQPLVRKTKED